MYLASLVVKLSNGENLVMAANIYLDTVFIGWKRVKTTQSYLKVKCFPMFGVVIYQTFSEIHLLN